MWKMYTRKDLPTRDDVRDLLRDIHGIDDCNSQDPAVMLIDNTLSNNYAFLLHNYYERNHSFRNSWLVPESSARKILTYQKLIEAARSQASQLVISDAIDISDIGSIAFIPDPDKSVQSYHLMNSNAKRPEILPTHQPVIPLSYETTPSDIQNVMNAISHKAGIYGNRKIDYIDFPTMTAHNYAGRQHQETPIAFGAIEHYPDLLKTFMEIHADKPLVKDILREFPEMAETGKVPKALRGMTMTNVIDCHTKQELLQKTFSRKAPSTANKCTFEMGVVAMTVSPRLPNKAKARLWQNAANPSPEMQKIVSETLSADQNNFAHAHTKSRWLREMRNDTPGYILAYPDLTSALYPPSDAPLDEIDQAKRNRIEIRDTSSMLQEMHKKMPDDIKSARRLHELHQDVSHAHRIIEHENLEKERLDVTNSRYAAIDESLAAVGFERMTNSLQMFEEGERQHNCVFSYRGKMLKEQSAFYTGIIDGDRHTLQVTLTEKGPHVDQLFKAYNRTSSDQADHVVDLALEVSQLPKSERGRAIEALIEHAEANSDTPIPLNYTATDLLKNALATERLLPDGFKDQANQMLSGFDQNPKTRETEYIDENNLEATVLNADLAFQ